MTREEADRRERIRAALARYEANQAKPGKRRTIKLFSVDGEDQRQTQWGDLLTAKGE